MKTYDELAKLNREFFQAETPEGKAEAEKKIKEYLDASYYSTKVSADTFVGIVSESLRLASEAQNEMKQYAKYVGIAFTEGTADTLGGIKPFIDVLSEQHRTEQQRFTKFMWAWFVNLASLGEGEYDGRNEASVKLAKKIMQLLENDGSLNLTALPNI